MTSLVTKTTWSAVASLANTVGRFIASVIIARRLGPSGVGQLAYLIWLIDFMNVFSNLGLQNSLTRFLAELYGRGRSSESSLFAGWIFRRYLISVITGGLLVALVSARFSRHASVGSATGLLVLLFMLQGLASLTTAELTGRQRFDTLARINGFAAILLVVGQIFGVYFFGLLGAIGGYIIGALLPGLFSLGMLRSGSPGWRPEPALQRRIWKYAAYTWLAAIVSAFVWSRVEVFFIERYWNPHEVAMFTIGLSLAALATQGPSLLLGALLPHFAALFGAGDKAAIDRAYSTGTRLMGLLLFPLAFGGAAVTPVLLPMLFGPQFAPAIPNAMVLMALSCLGFAGVGFFSGLRYGTVPVHSVRGIPRSRCFARSMCVDNSDLRRLGSHLDQGICSNRHDCTGNVVHSLQAKLFCAAPESFQGHAVGWRVRYCCLGYTACVACGCCPSLGHSLGRLYVRVAG